MCVESERERKRQRERGRERERERERKHVCAEEILVHDFIRASVIRTHMSSLSLSLSLALALALFLSEICVNDLIRASAIVNFRPFC